MNQKSILWFTSTKLKGVTSAGFYSAFINWETHISKDPGDLQITAFTIIGSNYPGEIRLFGNIFAHTGSNEYLDEFVSLTNPGGDVFIDNNRFNTSNVNFSAVFSVYYSCNESEPQVTITNNTLISNDNADNDSDSAFHLVNHKKFVISNNTALTSTANASIDIDLPNEAGLQAAIENNTAHINASIAHRGIDVEVEKDFMDDLNVTGHLNIAGNDYYQVDHYDEGDYITLIEGKKVPEVTPSPQVAISTGVISPTPSLTSLSAFSSASVTAKNPCDNLASDATAQKICNDFLSSPEASGNDKHFSHAFVVSNTQGLFDAVERRHLDGQPFSGSIIVLRQGTYQIPRQLRINHKVALVGEKSGDSLPEIKAGKDFVKQVHELISLVHLKAGKSQTTSGFYSTGILWDTSLDHDLFTVVCEAAIGSTRYPGNIRIYDNRFEHKGTKSEVYDYLKFDHSYGDTYVGHNTFDTTLLKYSTVDARCPHCQHVDPKLEIVSNSFVSDEKSTRKTISGALSVTGYKRFVIDGNQQKNAKAAAYIDVRLNNYDVVDGLIRNNKALETAPADQREIKIHSNKAFKQPLRISGSLTVVQNAHYTTSDRENIIALLGGGSESSLTSLPAMSPTPVPTTPTPESIQPTSTEQVVAKTSVINPTPALSGSAEASASTTHSPLSICDHMTSLTTITSSEIDACKTFLKDKKASGGTSFSMAVVVSSANELDQAVTGKFLTVNADTSKLVVLKNGTYQLPHSLNISHKVALVGTVKDGAYPVIRIANDFAASSENNQSLAYLYHEETVAETGFYSHHIHWDTTNHPRQFTQLYMGAINSQSYQGTLRFYENQFSETKHDYTTHYIRLVNATGGAFIESNRFDTAYLKTYAVFAYCESDSCIQTEPKIDIVSNRFHSRHIAYRKTRAGAIKLIGYMRFNIEGNQQETKDAAGTIYIQDHSNVKHLDGFVRNNIAHKDAPEFQRRIIVNSYLSPEQSVYVNGKLNVSGNDYYKFQESGLAIQYVDYLPGKQVASSTSPIPTPTAATARPAESSSFAPDFSAGSITPTQLLVSVSVSTEVPIKKSPCDYVTDDATAFATCNTFLKTKKASGNASFTHAFAVDNTEQLLEKTGLQEYDGKPVSGIIIILKSGTYEVPHPIQIDKQKVAMVGVKGADGTYPVIQAANDYKVIAGSKYVLLHLHAGSRSATTGFYSFNLNWRSSDLHTHYRIYESTVYGSGYNGEVRLYQNRFIHNNHNAWFWSKHFIVLNNAKADYYIDNNTFDTSKLTVSAIKASDSYDRSKKSAIQVQANTFTTSLEYIYPEIKAIVLSRYQQLSILDNVQQTPNAAGSIEIQFNNNETIGKAIVRNNRAHEDATNNQRTIWLKLDKGFEAPASVSGFIEVTGNTFYKFMVADLPAENYHYSHAGSSAILQSSVSSVVPASSKVPEVSTTATQPAIASATVSTYGTSQPNLTIKTDSTPSTSVPDQPTQRLFQSNRSINTTPIPTSATSPALSALSAQRPELTSSSAAPTEPLTNSPCNQLTSQRKTQRCQKLLDQLRLMEVHVSFSEAVAVKSSQELMSQINNTSETGKVILLHDGHYELDQQLHIRNPVALVSIGNAVIKSSHTFYPAVTEALLVLLNDEGAAHGFYTSGITWDISAPESPESKPFTTAIKALNFRGRLVVLDNDFQYHSTRDDVEAPAHYIDIQKSEGDVRIAESTFFTSGLKEGAIFASCKDCLSDKQSIDIVGNTFTKSDTETSTTVAIDVRHYKTLNVHRNQQETESAAAQINIVLPNYKNDINAIIQNNIAQSGSAEERRTIYLTVDRLAQVPVSIDGTVKVLRNQCYSIKQHGIPSNVLSLIKGSCSPSSAPQVNTNNASSGSNTGKDAAYGVGSVIATYLAALTATGAYGQTSLPFHGMSHTIFLKLATPFTWTYSKLRGAKGYYKPGNDGIKLDDVEHGKIFKGGPGEVSEKALLTNP